MVLERLLELLVLLSLLVSLTIVGFTVQGYRRNRSLSMLLLGAGVFTLSLLRTLAAIFSARRYGTGSIALTVNTVELVGVVLILVAIVQARREGL